MIWQGVVALIVGLILLLVGLGGTMSCWSFTANDFSSGDIGGGIIGIAVTITCMVLTLFGLVILVAGVGVITNVPGFQ